MAEAKRVTEGDRAAFRSMFKMLLAGRWEPFENTVRAAALAGNAILIELETVLAERAVLQQHCRLVDARHKDVWFWMGCEGEDPGSLACPVVMSAETLRELLEKSHE